MQWSLRLGRVNGVPVEAHWLLALLVGAVAYTGWVRAGLAGLVSNTALLLVAFACVLIHEIAHTLQAQAINFPVRRIWLLPLGGLAQLGRLPEHPQEELRIALAGPLVNLGLGLIFAALAGLWISANTIVGPLEFEVRLVLLRGGPPLPYGLLMLALTNLGLAAFNLVPAFPFDGARLLRSLLALVLSRSQATQIVVRLGWAIGLLCLLAGAAVARPFGLTGLITVIGLGLTAVLGTSAEELFERQVVVLRSLPVRAAVRQPTVVLSPTDPVTPALAATLKQLGHLPPLMPVLDQGRLVGLLPTRALAAAVARPAPVTVAEVMLPTASRLDADTDLWTAQLALADAAQGSLPVFDGEQLHGMLTAADIRATVLEPSVLLPIQPAQLISAGQPSL